MNTAPKHSAPVGLVVIGYGNELRRDDGLGPKLARQIEGLGLPGVQVITTHQLTLELADPISRAGAVVFIDAVINRSHVEVKKLAPATSCAVRAHVSEPGQLLLLAKEIWHQCPPTWWITIPAFELGFGEDLSHRAQAEMPVALAEFRRLACPGPTTLADRLA